MIRKFTLLFLLIFGLQYEGKSAITIYVPLGQDTTCIGEQITFYANYTLPAGYTGLTFEWYHNNVLTGVTPDTFFTTAPVEGDSVFCIIRYNTPFGPVVEQSNSIYVHRALSLNPRVLISLTFGSNPDCPGNPLTFTAYPIHGGLAPTYQWLINNVPVPGETNTTFTHIYGSADTVSVSMNSTAECRAFTVAYSAGVPIIHTFYTPSINISALRNPQCDAELNTFTAVIGSEGPGAYITWHVDTVQVAGALGLTYTTDSLYNGAHVYAILHTPDACEITDTTLSNVINMIVTPNENPDILVSLTHGANPGCLDSPVTFTATYTHFGTTPPLSHWYVNGVQVATNTPTYTAVFADGDLVTHRAITTDGNCYTHDTTITSPILMVRDSTPTTPLVSLIGNLLVANALGTYAWYFNGALIPGATGPNYHPMALGYYYCVRTDGYCRSRQSNIIYISLLDVNDVASSDVRVYPNPTTGLLHMDLGGLTDGRLDIYNVVGQGLSHRDLQGQTTADIDMSTWAAGNYFVVLTTRDGKVNTVKVTLNK